MSHTIFLLALVVTCFEGFLLTRLCYLHCWLERRYLYLASNQLNGTVPASLASLTKLTLLYLCGNAITGDVPASVLAMNITYAPCI